MKGIDCGNHKKLPVTGSFIVDLSGDVPSLGPWYGQFRELFACVSFAPAGPYYFAVAPVEYSSTDPASDSPSFDVLASDKVPIGTDMIFTRETFAAVSFEANTIYDMGWITQDGMPESLPGSSVGAAGDR